MILLYSNILKFQMTSNIDMISIKVLVVNTIYIFAQSFDLKILRVPNILFKNFRFWDSKFLKIQTVLHGDKPYIKMAELDKIWNF
jgi:hypothetical protein